MLIDAKGVVSLKPFKHNGLTLRVTGTHRGVDGWYHDVKCEETRETKLKKHEWIIAVSEKLG